MEAIFSQPFPLGYLLVDCISFDTVRQGVMKDGVEAGNVLNLGELFEADLKNGDGRGIVSARKRVSNFGPKTSCGCQLTRVQGLLASQSCGKCLDR